MCETSNKMTELDDNHPYEKFSADRWRWVVLVAMSITYSFIAMKIQLFSLIYHSLFISTKTSTTTVAEIFNTFQFVMDTSSQFAGPLCDRIGFRPVTFICGAILGLSSLISALVKIPEILFVTYSLLAGTAAGLLFAMGQFILPLYFDKSIGFAMGVMMSGLSIGQFFGPFLLTFLRSLYGRYAPLLLGAIYLNVCAAALALVSPRVTPVKRLSATGGETAREVEGNLRNSDSQQTGACEGCSSYYSSTSRKYDENDIEGSFDDIIAAESISEINDNTAETIGLLRVVCSNLKVLRYYRVLIIVLSISLSYITAINFLIIMPFAVMKSGHSIDLVTWSYSLSALCNFTSRLLIPALSDKILISKKWYILIGAMGAGFALVGLTKVTTPLMILVCIGIFGLCMGCTTSLQSLLIIEFMGLDYLPATFGANGFIMAILFMIAGPIIGIIRDQSGSYDITLLSIASLSFMSSVLWMLMPLALHLDKRKFERESISNNVNQSVHR